MDTTTKKEIARQDLIHALHDLGDVFRHEADLIRQKGEAVDAVARDITTNANDPSNNIMEMLKAADLSQKFETVKYREAELSLRIVRLFKESGLL